MIFTSLSQELFFLLKGHLRLCFESGKMSEVEAKRVSGELENYFSIEFNTGETRKRLAAFLEKYPTFFVAVKDVDFNKYN